MRAPHLRPLAGAPHGRTCPFWNLEYNVFARLLNFSQREQILRNSRMPVHLVFETSPAVDVTR
jgi:hypothetical protein